MVEALVAVDNNRMLAPYRAHRPHGPAPHATIWRLARWWLHGGARRLRAAGARRAGDPLNAICIAWSVFAALAAAALPRAKQEQVAREATAP